MLQGTISLREHLENMRQHIRRDADAGVLHPDHHRFALLSGVYPNAATPFGELGGVVQQVEQQLGQPGGIGFQIDRLGRERNCQFMSRSLNVGAAQLDGLIHYQCQFDSLFAELNLARADPRGVKQVVNEPHQLSQLALHHLLHLLGVLPCPAPHPQDLQAVAERSERVAEFVGQHRQEFILAAVGFPERLFHPHPVGDVDGHAADQGRLPVRAEDRELADERMMQNPVLMLQDLGRQDARLTGERLPVVLPELSGGLRWEDLVVGPAGELCPGRAEGLLGGVVDVHIAPFEVLDPRQAGQVVHETDEALLARP